MKKILALILSGIILAAAVITANATSISELEARQAELEAQQEEYRKQIESGNSKVAEQQGKVDALVGQIETVTEEIQISYKKIALLDKSIEEKQAAIDAANKEIEANMDVLRQRIKTIYISGDVSSLEIVLGAKDFSDFLDKIQLVQYVSNHDEKLINGIKEQLQAIAEEKAQLESDKAAQEEEQATLEAKKDELNTILEENKETLAGLQSDVAESEMNLSLSEEQLSGLSEEIQAYYRQQREEAERRRQQQQQSSGGSSSGGSSSGGSSSGGSSSGGDDSGDNGGGSSYDPSYSNSGSGWVWPTPGVITSEYGEGRSYETHNAIDIGTSLGTEIYAANSGTVVSCYSGCPHTNYGGSWCDCGGGYGNYVWILHDNGYETIYGHMVSTAVSYGQRVGAGQLIGYVGSSGWSTGPHLHFELRIDGVKSNPMNLY